jgi:hypothetical protein
MGKEYTIHKTYKKKGEEGSSSRKKGNGGVYSGRHRNSSKKLGSKSNSVERDPQSSSPYKSFHNIMQ